MSNDVRILLLADSHIGFDLPARPRVGRRRRGYDFLANYAAALQPALDGEADLVVHAGDVFDRPSVAPSIAFQGFEPLRRVADAGVPVFVVPGNHERSRLPHARFASHPAVHVFDRPRTFTVRVRGSTIALSGFPFERRDVRTRFRGLLDETGWREHRGARLLCIHHCTEGATVGPADFTFTTGDDVVRHHDVPSEFAAVLSGHIHRHQVLTTDLDRRTLRTPVLYPGSIERTSFAEVDEPKGYMVVTLSESEGDRDLRWQFRPLPARPMIRRELIADGMTASVLERSVLEIVTSSPSDAVLSIRVSGVLAEMHWRLLAPARLRAVAPSTMNVDVIPVGGFERRHSAARVQPAAESIQHSLFG